MGILVVAMRQALSTVGNDQPVVGYLVMDLLVIVGCVALFMVLTRAKKAGRKFGHKAAQSVSPKPISMAASAGAGALAMRGAQSAMAARRRSKMNKSLAAGGGAGGDGEDEAPKQGRLLRTVKGTATAAKLGVKYTLGAPVSYPQAAKAANQAMKARKARTVAKLARSKRATTDYAKEYVHNVGVAGKFVAKYSGAKYAAKGVNASTKFAAKGVVAGAHKAAEGATWAAKGVAAGAHKAADGVNQGMYKAAAGATWAADHLYDGAHRAAQGVNRGARRVAAGANEGARWAASTANEGARWAASTANAGSVWAARHVADGAHRVAEGGRRVADGAHRAAERGKEPIIAARFRYGSGESDPRGGRSDGDRTIVRQVDPSHSEAGLPIPGSGDDEAKRIARERLLERLRQNKRAS